MFILEFIKNYYREIIEVVAILASIVICCIRKKPQKVEVIDTLKELIKDSIVTNKIVEDKYLVFI